MGSLFEQAGLASTKDAETIGQQLAKKVNLDQSAIDKLEAVCLAYLVRSRVARALPRRSTRQKLQRIQRKTSKLLKELTELDPFLRELLAYDAPSLGSAVRGDDIPRAPLPRMMKNDRNDLLVVLLPLLNIFSSRCENFYKYDEEISAKGQPSWFPQLSIDTARVLLETDRELDLSGNGALMSTLELIFLAVGAPDVDIPQYARLAIKNLQPSHTAS